jgi:polyhydroxybutyrate depolymerase
VAGKSRRRHGFLKSELAILLTVAVLTITGMSVRAAAGLGKAEASPRVGNEVAAKLKASIGDAKPVASTTTAPPTSTTRPPAATAPSTTSTTVAPASIKWTNTTRYITYQGMERTYVVAEPTPAPTGKVPLIVVLHGVNSNPLAEEQRTGMLSVVGPAIVVYPAGYLHTWNAGHCCGTPVTMNLDDVGFVTTVAKQVLADDAHTTSSQVYLVGYSLGGKLAWDIACHGVTVFRGIATYGSVPVTACPDVAAVPAMVMAGTDDPQVITNPALPQVQEGGFTEDRTYTWVDQLRQADGCSAKSTSQTVGSETTRIWSDCHAGEAVAYTLFNGEDHTWPEGTTTTPSAQQIIWAFFRSLGAR